LSEFVLRNLLFSDYAIVKRWRDPSLFADYFSDDDYWKLCFLFDGQNKPPANPHKLLGWVGNFERDSLIHKYSDKVENRTPVLLYGDSFAACVTSEDDCFQGVLNADREFNMNFYLLNYGAGGYGVDQIDILFENSVGLYEKPFVIISLMTYDIDRSVLSVRTGQKPFYKIVNDKLELQGIPIYKEPDDFISNNPPGIHSYIYRFLTYNHYLPARLSTYWTEEQKIDHKIELNKKIILKIFDTLKKLQLKYIFLIFHPHGEVYNEKDWRNDFLVELFSEYNIPYISSRELIKIDVQLHNKNYYYADYYDPENQHPNSYQNKIISKKIKEIILEYQGGL
jgi:hypothetical protein